MQAKTGGITFVNGKPLLEEVRIIKTHEELENMRLSARVADSAFGREHRAIIGPA